MTVKIVIARSGATKQSMLSYGERWLLLRRVVAGNLARDRATIVESHRAGAGRRSRRLLGPHMRG